MEVLTYVPENVNLLLSGYKIEGWESITITRNSPAFKQIRGIRGKNTRVQIKDTSAVIKIETLQTELLNEVLSICLFSDTMNATARLDISLKETTGSTIFSTSTAYITAFPDLKYTSDISSLVWTINCEDSGMFVGNATSNAIGAMSGGISSLKNFATGAIDAVSGAASIINKIL